MKREDTTAVTPNFDFLASERRCRDYRLRILGLSQQIPALHIAPAFSCLEIVDCIYFGLMRRDQDGNTRDSFLLSKGHGALAQYAVLEKLGIITAEDFDLADKPGGRLGGHPDYGVPGIEASTGSLGHGLPIAVGMALADKVAGLDRFVYVVLSDGEMQEGSVWESMMLAPTLGLANLIAVLDLNDFQSLGRTSEIHPNFYPIEDKIKAFGWETVAVDGHDQQAIFDAVTSREGRAPLMVLARTIKGKGVSYMESVPIWHYRSPSPEEYRQALQELSGAEEA
jgi:transketolase